MTKTFTASPLSRRSALVLAGLGAGASMLAACGGGEGAAAEGLTVVTSCYPLAFLASRVGGDRVSLVDLTNPGVDAHGLELSVRQVMQVQEADLVLQIPAFQSALDDAIASAEDLNVVDISAVIPLLDYGEGADHSHEEDEAAGDGHEDHDGERSDEGEPDEGEGDHDGHDHGPLDPHFWHDPLRMAEVGDALAARLSEIAPDGADDFVAAAAELRAELEELDAELLSLYEEFAGRPFITSHAAYAYLADRYELQQIGIAGVDPETEPSPRRLLQLEEVIAEEEVSTIFFETTASPKVAQTLAENVGIEAAELDNLETQLDEQQDYPAIMRSNSQALIESWT